MTDTGDIKRWNRWFEVNWWREAILLTNDSGKIPFSPRCIAIYPCRESCLSTHLSVCPSVRLSFCQTRGLW